MLRRVRDGEHPVVYLIDKESARDDAVKSAKMRDSPSKEASAKKFRSTQKPENPSAAFNYSPLDLTPSPISIYNFAFARFKEKINTAVDDLSFSTEEVKSAFRFIQVSSSYYPTEEIRLAHLQTLEFVGLNGIWKAVNIPSNKKDTIVYHPDGTFEIRVEGLSEGMIIVAYLELKNSLGEGGKDSSNQGQLYYMTWVALDQVRVVRNARVH